MRFDLTDTAFCELRQTWLPTPEADALQANLLQQLPWEARAIRIFGREVMQPRLVTWIGDSDAIYTYSGTRHEPRPWPPELAALRARISSEIGRPLNSVLCNLYRNGMDSMGMHSDSEPELGPEPLIASLSLGASRKFQLRAQKSERTSRLDLMLDHGSLLIMGGDLQHRYRHGVPKQPTIQAPRINLTFRWVSPQRPG